MGQNNTRVVAFVVGPKSSLYRYREYSHYRRYKYRQYFLKQVSIAV